MKIRLRMRGLRSMAERAGRKARIARRLVGREVAENTLDEVKKRLPGDQSEWLRVYRAALAVQENQDGTRWAVLGITPVDLGRLPAERTLLQILPANDPVVRAVQGFTWTLDTLPAVRGGYASDAVTRSASTQDVEAVRKAMQDRLPEIKAALTAAGAQIVPELPRVGGQVYADLRFLQLQLEYGLAGFPAAPHWHPAAAAARNKAGRWIAAAKHRIRAAVSEDQEPPPAETMTATEEALYKKIREVTWGLPR